MSSPTRTRGKGPSYDPLYEDAKALADQLWEEAQDLAEVLAPNAPADAEELDPVDQWQILESAAAAFSPGYWDDPDAIEDLFELRKRFQGRESSELKTLAKVAREKQRAMPDPSISPASPEFEKMRKRVGA
ncbi:MAG: hypothetical protein H0U59_10920 [Gemmatimonadaceae bacterium]|nr:hypothetical protein [Gemmatimonadaceae bacterium]